MGINKNIARQLFEQARYPEAELNWRTKSQTYSVYSVQVEFELWLEAMNATGLPQMVEMIRMAVVRMQQSGVFSQEEMTNADNLLGMIQELIDVNETGD